MLFAFVYLLLRHIVRLIAGPSNEQMNTEVELVVLRHQLMVLKRRASRSFAVEIACSGRNQQGASSISVVVVPR